MSSRQRIVLLAIAAVVLVGGIVLASSSGDDDEPSGGGETSAAQTTPAQTDEATGGTEAEDGQQETEQNEPPPPRVETIRMRDRAPVGEPQTLGYERGETIRLRFVSDVAEEVHIHGFDRYVQVPAGGSKTTRFDASLEGIFEIEAHSTGELLGKLEIRPR